MAFSNHRCKSEDPSDKINYIWCFLLFVVLASACWIMPIALSLNGNNSKSPYENVTLSESVSERITVSVNCWPPSRFTQGNINYVHKVCKSAMETFLNKESNSSGVAKIADLDFGMSYKSKDELKQMSYPDFLVKREHTVEMKMKAKENRNQLMTEEIPVFLFLIGVGLVIPKLIWSFLLSVGNLNIHETLCAASDRKEYSRSLARETGFVVNNSLQNSSCLGFGYLIVKVLYAIACVVGVLYLGLHILPELNKSPDDSQPDYTTSVHVSEHTPYSELKLCYLDIKQLQNVQNYVLQCSFVEEKRALVGNMNLGRSSSKFISDKLSGWSSSYMTIALIAREVLILMAIVNVIQLLTWVVRLLCCNQAPGSKGQLSIDQRLFSRLAFIHVDGVTLRELMAMDGRSQDDDGGAEEKLQPL